MNLNEELSTCRIMMPIIKREVNVDISEDVTLPDYLPEIRKVLCVRELLLPPAKFIGGGKVEISGVADFTLIYVSGEGKLCSAPISAEYSFSLPLENMSDFEISEGLTAIAHTVSDGSSVRLSAPRRLQLRSRLRSFVGVWGKMLCAEKIVGKADESSIERLRRRAENAEILCESSDIVTLEDEYLLPDENSRIALADSSVSVSDARADGDSLRISGEAIIKLLVDGGEAGGMEKVVRKLPFEAETELDGIELSSTELCRAMGYVTDLSLKVEEGKAAIQVNLILEVCVAYNREIAYTADLYSTECKCNSTARACEIPNVICNKNSPLSVSERIPLEELGIPEGAELCDLLANATVDSATIEDGKYILRGMCKYIMIFSKDGEYACADFRTPLKYECDASASDSAISGFDVTAGVISCKGRLDRDSVNVDSELTLSVSLFGGSSAEILERAEFGEKLDKRKGVFAVCYPSSDDTLWSIGKRYSVPCDEISGNPESDLFLVIEM